MTTLISTIEAEFVEVLDHGTVAVFHNGNFDRPVFIATNFLCIINKELEAVIQQEKLRLNV